MIGWNRRTARAFLLAGVVASAVGACGGDGDDGGLADRVVYTMTNATAGNDVLAFRRNDDGTLTKLGTYATGGNGIGSAEISPATPQDGIDVLASQGSLRLTPDKRFLLAVNTGSNTVSSFRVDRDGVLARVDVEPSGGLQPNAIGARNDIVYVANVGAPVNGFTSNITGFTLGGDGTLTPIASSTRSLSTATAQPANLAFSPDGTLLAVSELTTNRITMFPVAANGTLNAAVVNASSGGGPFGAAFIGSGAGRLIVAEAQMPGVPGSASSYSVAASGALTPVSASLSSGQMATCWTILTPDQRRLYTSNTGSGNLSSYQIANDATLTLQQAVASPLEGAMSGPVDGGVSETGGELYVLDSGAGAITAHRIAADGSLTKIQTVSGQGIPALGAAGLVVR
jgi:6-phosphogluconolactonase (cycloisomerase 2 family)